MTLPPPPLTLSLQEKDCNLQTMVIVYTQYWLLGSLQTYFEGGIFERELRLKIFIRVSFWGLRKFSIKGKSGFLVLFKNDWKSNLKKKLFFD